MTTYLLKRDSGYYFRYCIPARFRPYVPRSELRYSLATHSRQAAKRLARVLAFRVESLLLEAETQQVKLNGHDIRQTIQAELSDLQTSVTRWHIRTPRSLEDIDHQQNSLKELAEIASYTRATSDYSHIESKVTALFGLDLPPSPESEEYDAYAVACREWAEKTDELYSLLNDLLDGKTVGSLDRITGEKQTAALTGSAPQQPTPPAPLLSEEMEAFIADQVESANIGEGMVASYREALNVFVLICGDQPVTAVTFDTARHFRDTYRKLPKHRNKAKEYRGRSLDELLAMEIPQEHRLSPTTISEHLGRLRKLFDQLESRNLIDRNPFKEVRLKAGLDDERIRQPYDLSDLEMIFSSALYDEQSKYHRTKTTTASHWWLPVVGAYTGARISELVQMRLDDVKTVDGVLIADIVRDAEHNQRLKTKAAQRAVPLHPQLIELGFSDYIEQMGRAGADRVFEGFPMGIRKAGEFASKWWSRYRDKHFPHFQAEGKVFHSYRHTLNTQLRRNGVAREDREQLCGHSEGKNNSTNARYDHGATIQKLFQEVSKVDYCCKALAGLPQSWRHMTLIK